MEPLTDMKGLPTRGLDDDSINAIIDGAVEEMLLADDQSLSGLSLDCLDRMNAVIRAATGDECERLDNIIKRKTALVAVKPGPVHVNRGSF